MLDNTLNQPSKFRTKNWVKINDGSRGTYNINSQIEFKTLMLKPSLWDYSDASIFVKGTISVAAAPPPAVNSNNNDKEVHNCEINNTQIDNA